jgi:Skp family chaperone for outer membrane proteins
MPIFRNSLAVIKSPIFYILKKNYIMKKLIFSVLFLFVATFTFAQSATTNSTALEIMKVTPEQYATKVQKDLQEVCNLNPEQAEKVYEISLKTANNVYELEELNARAGNEGHNAHVNQTVQYGESLIVNMLDKNQVAAYNKKERLLRKADLIREREAMGKAYNEANAERN